MTTKTLKRKGKDITNNLPTRVIWRDALRMLEVGDSFVASQLDRTLIANQITYMRQEEDREFTTERISREEFEVVRIK